MVPNRLTSTCYYHAYLKKKPVIILITFINSNHISIPNMKNTTKKKTPTTSPLVKAGNKKKAESPVTSKNDITKRANQNGGRVGKKMAADKSPKKKSVQIPKKLEKNGKGSHKGIVGTKAGKSKNNRSAPQTPDQKVRAHSVHSTPSAITLNLTSSSKRAVSMMNTLRSCTIFEMMMQS